MAGVKELFLNPDGADRQAEFILGLIADAAEARELPGVVSDVIQVAIAGGVGHPHVKKLAYDLCRAVPLVDADYGLLMDGVKNDVASGQAEVQVAALLFLPHLPPHRVADMVDKGEVTALVVPATRDAMPSVRAAATACLGALLLRPEVQEALAASPACDEWWEAVTDGLADDKVDVILAALAATNKLFEAAETATHGSTAMRTSTQRAALRMCLAMGPLIDTWRMLPSHAQVAVAALMGHIVAAVVQLDPAQVGGGGTIEDAAGNGGNLSGALSGAISYLGSALQSLNPAVKLEAGRVLLRMSVTARAMPPLSPMRVAAAVPPSVAASAISALLDLKDRVLVEAALGDVIALVAGHLDVLPVPARVDVLRRLWPMIGLLQSPTDRATAFAASWRTALDMHLQAAEAAARGVPQADSVLLPSLLADAFIQDVITTRGAVAAALANGNGASGSVSAAPASTSADAASAATPASAGVTGASALSPAAAGPTGASTISAGALGSSGGAAALMGVGSPRSSDAAASLGAPRSKLSAAQQLVASGAKTMTDTVSGAVYTAADLARTAGINLPRFLDAPLPALAAQLPASLKQELVCSLLGVLAQHAAADLALQLPSGERVEPPAAKHDEQHAGGTHSPADANGSLPGGETTAAGAGAGAGTLQPLLRAPSTPRPLPLHPNAAAHGEQQERTVLWLDAAVAVLTATAGCLHWEPLLPPPLPGQPPTPKLPAMEAVNLSTVPVDLWLQLLQSTCAASRAVLAVHGQTGLKSIYRTNGGRMLARLTAFDVDGSLARSLEGACVTLQALIQKALMGWRTLALAVRPRVLWVAAHYLELPAILEDTWSCLLACVEDTLLKLWRLESDAHTRLLAASARDGVLFKRTALPQLGAAQGKAGQAQFDAAAASALVELPEYRADGLQVSLCVLQYLVWLVQANAARRAATGKAGPAEVALARKLLEVVRAASQAEATGVDLKEWCRRMSRCLAAAAEQDVPGHMTAAGAAGGPAFAIAAPAAAKRATLPGGYNAVAGFNALGFGGGGSSDDDSDSGAPGGDDSSDWAGGRRSSSGSGPDGSGSKASTSSNDDDAGSDSSSDAGAPHGGSGVQPAAQATDPQKAARAKLRATKVREAGEIARRNLTVGNPEASSGAWGYPFTGPRSRTLFISRRSRRHRLLRWHLAAALAASEAEAGAGTAGAAAGSSSGCGGGLTLAASGSTDATGPVFSAGSGFRLDKRAFWHSLLPGSGDSSGWEELTGPNDPIVLSGCYTLAKAGGAELLVSLRAYNRLPMDVEGVEVMVRLVGPVRPERREVSWMLPRLLPTEVAQHSFKLAVTGYGHVQLHARILLPVGGEAAVPALRCRALTVSMASSLRVPRGLPAGPSGFLEAWAVLPVSAELPVVAAWSGIDGLLLALSALARAPLRCAWRRALPAVCGAQAAYLSSPAAAPSESLAMVVTLQLMPPASWDATCQPGAAGSGTCSSGEGEAGCSDPGNGARPHDGRARDPGADAPTPVEAARRLCGDMVAVGIIAARSSSHEVIAAVRDHAAEWVADLAQGTLALGLTPPHMAASEKPLMHPSIACMASRFNSAALAVPLPDQVPDPEMPPPPKFTNRLRNKADEEDSDAEDEELPPTQAEAARRDKALEEYKGECRKVLEKHREALATRAASVLHRAALAEWKRLSGAC